jgi:FtsP/CotA-like multicopper oxidase with cupredoxin domain
MMGGFLGDRILVNGKPDASFSAATRVYRFRFLNGSNSRTYKLAWSDGSPMIVLGTDGGLLAAPVERPYVMLGVGERVEVWADLSDRPVGSSLVLKSLAFTPGGMGGGTLPDGAPFDILRVTVDRAEPETLTLPATLTPITRYRLEDAVNAASPRAFGISFAGGQWLLNGLSFEMNGITANEIVNLGDLEVWEFVNQSGMPMMQMLHPMHVHAVQFQIYERTVNAGGAPNYATVRDGFVDSGWKDTLILMPGERAKVLMRFWPHPGFFLYHCHNLEHEDMGFMRNFRIDGQAPTGAGDEGIPTGALAAIDAVTAGTGHPVEIRYRIARAGTATSLAIFDVEGRLVRALAAGPRGAGSHVATWDRRNEAGARAATGIYLVRLRAGETELARKVVLLPE